MDSWLIFLREIWANMRSNYSSLTTHFRVLDTFSSMQSLSIIIHIYSDAPVSIVSHCIGINPSLGIISSEYPRDPGNMYPKTSNNYQVLMISIKSDPKISQVTAQKMMSESRPIAFYNHPRNPPNDLDPRHLIFSGRDITLVPMGTFYWSCFSIG